MMRVLAALRLLLLLLLLLLAAARADAAALPPFTDGDFADASWELVTFSFKSGGGALPGGTVEATQDVGGNPGFRRRIADNVPNAPSTTEYATVWGVHIHPTATYVPATQGAIASVD
jgi:hypothetical protein